MANHVLHTQTTGPLFDKILICGWTVVVKVLTARKISKDVVALLGEGDFVDSVADEAGFQQVASVLSCFTAVCKPLHVMMKQQSTTSEPVRQHMHQLYITNPWSSLFFFPIVMSEIIRV